VSEHLRGFLNLGGVVSLDEIRLILTIAKRIDRFMVILIPRTEDRIGKLRLIGRIRIILGF